MSKITFSDREVKILQKNSNVQRVSNLAITYSDDFKNKFMDEYQVNSLDKSSRRMDMDILGIKRSEQSAYKWKKAYENDGLIGLSDTRRTASGRPLKRELSKAEIIERQEAKIKLLEGQVELLKKARNERKEAAKRRSKPRNVDLFSIRINYEFVVKLDLVCKIVYDTNIMELRSDFNRRPEN